MTVRKATLADARSIARIHVAAWRVAYRGMLPDDVLAALSEDKRERQWQEWLVREDIDILVGETGEDGGAVITGFASAGVSRDEDARPGAYEIHALYVDPASWRSGYGRMLVATTIDAVKARGATSVTLWVLEKNDAARRFYEKVGFVADGGRKIDATGAVDVRYRIDA